MKVKIIYLVKNLKLILWRLPKASKNPEKFWQQWVTNSPFERAPYHRHTNQIRVGGRILGCCSQKVFHNSQQSGYRRQFQGHQRGKNAYNDKQGEQHFLEVSPRFQNGESTSSGESTFSNIFSSSGSTCRKAKSILFKLEKTNTRSKYFKHNTGLRDTFSRETLPNKIAKPSGPERRTLSGRRKSRKCC